MVRAIDKIIDTEVEQREKAREAALKIIKVMEQKGVDRLTPFFSTARQTYRADVRKDYLGRLDLELYRLVVLPVSNQLVGLAPQGIITTGGENSRMIPIPIKWDVVYAEPERLGVFKGILEEVAEVPPDEASPLMKLVD